MIAIFEIPRLPTPIATREPGLRPPAIPLASSSARTAPGISASFRRGKCWRTGTNTLESILCAHALEDRLIICQNPFGQGRIGREIPDAFIVRTAQQNSIMPRKHVRIRADRHVIDLRL